MKLSRMRSWVFALTALTAVPALAQQTDLQYFRTPGLQGLNVFETPKTNTVAFDGLKVRVGGDFAIQLQGLRNNQEDTSFHMDPLRTNLNLPTANLNLDVQLADGVRMHMRSYLSSRHHTETWVKGGYIQMDKLDFIKKDFLKSFMDIATIKVGLDELNYGDAHFRRSDNANAIYNPFVGNYIMDAFTTEAFVEINIQKNGLLAVLGASNGNLNQSVTGVKDDMGINFHGKLGYDKQLNDDLRVRLTASYLGKSHASDNGHLYAGDRTGARYYGVMQTLDEGDAFTSGRFAPRMTTFNAIQINPFVKFKGLEFFGIYEMVNGEKNDVNGAYTQMAAELLYRFGATEEFYVGGRYNNVSGNLEGAPDMSQTRMNFGAGWFMTPNTLMKVEYVNHTYAGESYVGTKYENGSWNGFVVEAVIGF